MKKVHLSTATTRHANPPAAFTLIELAVVVAIIAILAVLASGPLTRMREKSQAAKCAANLKAIGAATGMYLAENNGFLPAVYNAASPGSGGSSGDNNPAWYWNLAPYLGVARWDTVTQYLGPQGGRVAGPNVFTCPAHGSKEAQPIKFPSLIPVSYAFSTLLSSAPVIASNSTQTTRRYSIAMIKSPSKKIWLSDSPHPTSLNVSIARWAVDASDSYAWPRQAFTRHAGSGNALFFDGHVESIAYTNIASSNSSATSSNVTKFLDLAK